MDPEEINHAAYRVIERIRNPVIEAMAAEELAPFASMVFSMVHMDEPKVGVFGSVIHSAGVLSKSDRNKLLIAFRKMIDKELADDREWMPVGGIQSDG